MAIIDCSCRGVNPNCEKCDGKGYYSPRIVKNKKSKKSSIKKFKYVKPPNKVIERKSPKERIREYPIGDLTVGNIILTYDISVKYLRKLLSGYQLPLAFDTKIDKNTWNAIKDNIIEQSLRMENIRIAKWPKRRQKKKIKRK